MRWIAVCVWAGVLLAGRAIADSSAPAPSPAPSTMGRWSELVFETTPGKPMQLAREGESAETIVARREGARITLRVTRNVGEHEEGRAALSDAEWRKLEAVVAAHGLARWKARPTKEVVYDYSSAGFVLRGSDGKVVNEQHWGQPCAGLEHPYALAEALGRLAKAKVKSPTLFYFAP